MKKKAAKLTTDSPELPDWRAAAARHGWGEDELRGLDDCVRMAAARGEITRVIAVDAARVELVTRWTDRFSGTDWRGQTHVTTVDRAQRWTWTKHRSAVAVYTDKPLDTTIPDLLPTPQLDKDGREIVPPPPPPARVKGAPRSVKTLAGQSKLF